MLNFKRLSIITALVLCFVFLVGCSGNSAGNTISDKDMDKMIEEYTEDSAKRESPSTAPEDIGDYSEVAAVVTGISGKTVSYDVYGFVDGKVNGDTIQIKNRTFENSGKSDSFTVANEEEFFIGLYNEADDTTTPLTLADLKAGDILVLLTDRESNDLTGAIVYPAQ